MDSAVAFAESALERGDYNQCLALLEDLSEKYPINSKEGPQIRMLMITAWMGKGEDEKAIEICRQLSRCRDNEMRQTSKQLLSVLESPSLARPKNWSIQLPNLDLNPRTGKNSYQLGGGAIVKRETHHQPPTGPTRGLSLGFSTLVLVILTALTILLSGCVQITTEIDIPGPDRIKLEWEVESPTEQLLPWQVEFEESLTNFPYELKVFKTQQGKQRLRTPILKSKEANLSLQKIFTNAAQSAELRLIPPTLSLKERNWVVGVQQELGLIVDLKGLPQIPGLKLLILINSSKNNNLLSSPLKATVQGDQIYWTLEQGQVNTLSFHQWRWNQLGLGSLSLITLLMVILVLQRIRLQIGFGFPELPP